MNRINKTGEGAYVRYTELFNDAAPVPTFSNDQAAFDWAAAQTRIRLYETLNFEDDDSEDE
jgi:hypothetical protein